MYRQSVIILIVPCVLAIPPLFLKIKSYEYLMQIDKSGEAILTAFLKSREFNVSRENSADSQFFSMHAYRGSCEIELREVSPRGYDRAAMKSLAGGRQIFYVDNGAVSTEQPIWKTRLYIYRRRLAASLGWPLKKRLTFAVMPNGSCAVLDWAELARHVERNVSNPMDNL